MTAKGRKFHAPVTDDGRLLAPDDFWLIDYATGSSERASCYDLSQRQLQWIHEYKQWEQVYYVCKEKLLPLGMKAACRQMDFIQKDFLAASIARGKLIGMLPEPLLGQKF